MRKTSFELMNHYNEISKKSHVVDDKEDTGVLGLQEYGEIKYEQELLDILAKANEDVKYGRISSIYNTFNDIRNTLLERVK